MSFPLLRVNTESATVGLRGKSMFDFVRNPKTAFQSSFAVQHSHRRVRVSVSPHPRQPLGLPVLGIRAILTGVLAYLL